MSQPMNPYDNAESRPPGMSGTTKVLLGLGIGCGVLALLCCGGAGVTMYWFGKSIQESMSKDPAKIREVTNEIVTIDIPASFQPEMSMDMQIPFAGGMQMAMYRDPAAGATLTLTQFTSEAIANDPEMREKFETSVDQQHKKKQMQVNKSENFETTIHGEAATFAIAEGTADNAAGELWQVTGSFHGKAGLAQLMLEAKSSNFTKEQVLELLKSMK